MHTNLHDDEHSSAVTLTNLFLLLFKLKAQLERKEKKHRTEGQKSTNCMKIKFKSNTNQYNKRNINNNDNNDKNNNNNNKHICKQQQNEKVTEKTKPTNKAQEKINKKEREIKRKSIIKITNKQIKTKERAKRV